MSALPVPAAPADTLSCTGPNRQGGGYRYEQAAAILAPVAELGLDVRKVAAGRNLEIVPRSLHTTMAQVQFAGEG